MRWFHTSASEPRSQGKEEVAHADGGRPEEGLVQTPRWKRPATFTNMQQGQEQGDGRNDSRGVPRGGTLSPLQSACGLVSCPEGGGFYSEWQEDPPQVCELKDRAGCRVEKRRHGGRGGSTETSQEAITVIQAKDLAGRRGGGESLPDPGYGLR